MAMNEDFFDSLLKSHQECDQCPKSEEIAGFFNELLGILYPTFSNEVIRDEAVLRIRLQSTQDKLYLFLLRQKHENAQEVATYFMKEVLPKCYRSINMDIEAIYEGDPAAISPEEIKRSYPGFYAIAAYRIAHALLKLKIQNLPRSITEHAHKSPQVGKS